MKGLILAKEHRRRTSFTESGPKVTFITKACQMSWNFKSSVNLSQNLTRGQMILFLIIDVIVTSLACRSRSLSSRSLVALYWLVTW